MFTVTHVDSSGTSSTAAAINIMARNQREATKLYGLVLRHKGFLKPLGGVPCEVSVSEYNSNRRGQVYKVWDNKDKIYVECIKSANRVSNTILNKQNTMVMVISYIMIMITIYFLLW